MSINDITVDFPTAKEAVEQDQEWFDICCKGKKTRLRVHDYDKVYQYPGLYEKVVADRLKCRSPEVVCHLLDDHLEGWLTDNQEIHALDLGAGNGMVGEELKKRLECDTLVGVDIFPEAKTAALRDRPGVYDHYCVADLTKEEDVDKLAKIDVDYNLMITVAALGFGDIPVDAFVNAFNLLEKESLVAFNIKDRFLSNKDETGFNQAIANMCDGSFQVLDTHRYRHRVSMAGDPLYYVAVIGKKQEDADPNACMADLQ